MIELVATALQAAPNAPAFDASSAQDAFRGADLAQTGDGAGQAAPFDAVLDGFVGQAQKLVEAGAAIEKPSAASFDRAARLANIDGSVSASLTAMPNGVDLSGLVRAYDFAMRSYLMSKIVSEASGGLKSLWQAQ